MAISPKPGDTIDCLETVLKRISGEKIYNLYISPNVIKVIKPWTTIWAGNAACI
jgi:hypothetical protein